MPVVQQLIDDLQGFPGDSLVVLQTSSGIVQISSILKADIFQGDGMQTVAVLTASDVPDEDLPELMDLA